MVVEPDNVMNGPFWPASWRTGWVSFRYSDGVGNSPSGRIVISASTLRAAALTDHTAVVDTYQRVIEIVDGKPFAPFIVLNGDGDPCFEVPISDDPDVEPDRVQVVYEEQFTSLTGGPNPRYAGATIYLDPTVDNTLDNPLWATDDLGAVEEAPGVVQERIWKVPHEADGIPAAAKVGNVVWYLDTGRITEVTSV